MAKDGTTRAGSRAARRVGATGAGTRRSRRRRAPLLDRVTTLVLVLFLASLAVPLLAV